MQTFCNILNSLYQCFVVFCAAHRSQSAPHAEFRESILILFFPLGISKAISRRFQGRSCNSSRSDLCHFWLCLLPTLIISKRNNSSRSVREKKLFPDSFICALWFGKTLYIFFRWSYCCCLFFLLWVSYWINI